MPHRDTQGRAKEEKREEDRKKQRQARNLTGLEVPVGTWVIREKGKRKGWEEGLVGCIPRSDCL